MWTLEVADKKESILEAANSIPTFRTIEACQAILRHCTRPTTTKAFDRLSRQLHTSLLDARTHRHSTSAPWKDAIILGRALIHILLPATSIFTTERSTTWSTLSKFWPGDELSYIDGFSELLLIALSIAPTPPKAPEIASINWTNIDPRSIPLYIASLLSSITYSDVHQAVVRSLITTCLTVEEVPIEHVLVCAWALKSMAATAERMSIGLPLCDGFWRAYKSNTDVAEQVIAAIQVLKPDSTRQCDHAFLKIIATLLAELTKSSTHWNSFDKSTSRIDLLRAVVFLTKVKEPGGLRNDAIKIMDILAKRPNLRYLEMQEYHLVADTIIAQISSNPLADLRRSTSIDLLKTTSDFALRIAPGSTQYQSFHPYRAQWLRSITYLATEKAGA